VPEELVQQPSPIIEEEKPAPEEVTVTFRYKTVLRQLFVF